MTTNDTLMECFDLAASGLDVLFVVRSVKETISDLRYLMCDPVRLSKLQDGIKRVKVGEWHHASGGTVKLWATEDTNVGIVGCHFDRILIDDIAQQNMTDEMKCWLETLLRF